MYNTQPPPEPASAHTCFLPSVVCGSRLSYTLDSLSGCLYHLLAQPALYGPWCLLSLDVDPQLGQPRALCKLIQPGPAGSFLPLYVRPSPVSAFPLAQASLVKTVLFLLANQELGTY